MIESPTFIANSVGLVMVKEIPTPLVRANQVMLIIGTVLALLLSSKVIVVLLFAITLISLLFGPRANIAFRFTRPLLGSRLFYAPTESVELQRFSQLIATTCLALASLILVIFNHGLGWVPVVFVVIAATSAVAGYCIGCQVYFPYKVMVGRMRKQHPSMNAVFDFVAGTGRFRPPFQEKFQPLMLMGLAHEALRECLDGVENQAKQLTPATLPALTSEVHDLIRCVEHHANQEDNGMYPPFEAKRTGITKSFTDEHNDIHDVQNDAVVYALEAAAANSSKMVEATEAVLFWSKFNRDHFNHEEELLMPHVPRIFTYDEAVGVVQNILKIEPSENPAHFKYVFTHIKPGQRYAYINILKECCAPDEFAQYAKELKPMVPTESWEDFVNAARMA